MMTNLAGFGGAKSGDDVDDAEIDVVLGRTGVPARRGVRSALPPKADMCGTTRDVR